MQRLRSEKARILYTESVQGLIPWEATMKEEAGIVWAYNSFSTHDDEKVLKAYIWKHNTSSLRYIGRAAIATDCKSVPSGAGVRVPHVPPTLF
jgi:hypothetical protein